MAENVLAKPLHSGLSGVCLCCVIFWGNVMFKLLEHALLLAKEISLERGDGAAAHGFYV